MLQGQGDTQRVAAQLATHGQKSVNLLALVNDGAQFGDEKPSELDQL